MKYDINIRWSKEYNCWFAEIPDLPGCKTDGETPEEALKELKTVEELWIEVQTERGFTVPEPEHSKPAKELSAV